MSWPPVLHYPQILIWQPWLPYLSLSELMHNQRSLSLEHIFQPKRRRLLRVPWILKMNRPINWKASRSLPLDAFELLYSLSTAFTDFLPVQRVRLTLPMCHSRQRQCISIPTLRENVIETLIRPFQPRYIFSIA